MWRYWLDEVEEAWDKVKCSKEQTDFQRRAKAIARDILIELGFQVLPLEHSVHRIAEDDDAKMRIHLCRVAEPLLKLR